MALELERPGVAADVEHRGDPAAQVAAEKPLRARVEIGLDLRVGVAFAQVERIRPSIDPARLGEMHVGVDEARHDPFAGGAHAVHVARQRARGSRADARDPALSQDDNGVAHRGGSRAIHECGADEGHGRWRSVGRRECRRHRYPPTLRGADEDALADAPHAPAAVHRTVAVRAVGDIGGEGNDAQVRGDEGVRPGAGRAAGEPLVALAQPIRPDPRQRRCVEVVREIGGAVAGLDRRDVALEGIERRLLGRRGGGGGDEEGREGQTNHGQRRLPRQLGAVKTTRSPRRANGGKFMPGTYGVKRNESHWAAGAGAARRTGAPTRARHARHAGLLVRLPMILEVR